MDQMIGRMLDNRYELLELIGSGGMAMVYKAKCHRLNRLVAVKGLKSDFASDADFRRRFYDESQAIAMLSHPNIVSVYDVSRSSPEYIVMELIDGITLKQYMERRGRLNWRESLHFITQIMKGLSHAHSRGIVHRDIKPQNIMVLRDGSVKVTDFGIACLSNSANTMTQEALGSVHYISPEQAKGNRPDARSDIYSAGVVLYEMLTGRLPFEGDSAVSVAIQHLSSVPLSPREIDPDVSEALEKICMKAMASDIDRRYPTADAMLADLEEFRKNPAIDFRYQASAPAEHPIAIRGIPQTYPKTTAEKVAASRTNQPRPATGRIPQPQQAPKRPQQADQGIRRQTVSQNTAAIMAMNTGIAVYLPVSTLSIRALLACSLLSWGLMTVCLHTLLIKANRISAMAAARSRPLSFSICCIICSRVSFSF